MTTRSIGSPAVAASLFVTDHGFLGETIAVAEEAGADAIHIDVMDGGFAPAVSFGADVVAAIAARTDLCVDVHLQIGEPGRHVSRFVEAGANILTFHAEATHQAYLLAMEIRERGALAGLALNPATPVEALDSVLDVLDMALVMTTNPGGAGFIPGMLPKVAAVRSRIEEGGHEIRLAVDGGVGPRTVEALVANGADWLVTGSAMFRGEAPPAELVQELRRSAVRS